MDTIGKSRERRFWGVPTGFGKKVFRGLFLVLSGRNVN